MSGIEEELAAQDAEQEDIVEDQPEPEITPEPAPEPEAPKAAEAPEPMVPLAALKEVRQELQALKQMQPKPEPVKPPDYIDNPDGYNQFIGQQVQTAVMQTKLQMSRAMAEQQFGADAVQDAIDYFNDKPFEESSRFLNEPLPFHAAIQHVQKVRAVEQIGDPAKWIADKEAEIRARLQAEMVAEQVKAKAGAPAPSLANVTGSGGATAPGWSGPADLDDLL